MQLPELSAPNIDYTTRSTPTPTGNSGPGPTHSASPLPSPSPSPTASTGPAAAPAYNSWLHQSGGVLADAAGNPVVLRGVGWYGFDGSEMLDLPASPSRLGTDVSTVMQRLHMMGINLVTFSISFSKLYQNDGVTRKISQTTVHVQCPGDSSQASIINSVTIPGFAPAPNTPLLTRAPQSVDGYCNTYLPDVSLPVVQRLAAIVDIFTRNGFYVMLHEKITTDPTLATNQNAFTGQWMTFAQDLITYGGAFEGITQPTCTADPNHSALSICRNVILGVMSDADQLSTLGMANLTWEPNNNNPALGAHQMLIPTLFELASLMPRAMFLVTGGWQFGYSTTYNIAVNANDNAIPTAAGPAGVVSASGFFRDVLLSALEPRLLFGFKAFGPTTDHYMVNFATSVSAMSAKVSNDLDASYGLLSTAGVPDNQTNQMHPFVTMPVAFGANPADPNDQVFLEAMHDYMRSNNMPHFVWWCWNGLTTTNSGVTDGTYYTTLQPRVINYLSQALGLTPP